MSYSNDYLAQRLAQKEREVQQLQAYIRQAEQVKQQHLVTKVVTHAVRYVFGEAIGVIVGYAVEWFIDLFR